MNDKGYKYFLTIELAKLLSLIDCELEYDLMWSEGQVLYEVFLCSSFNKESQSEYDCLNEFLKSLSPSSEISIERQYFRAKKEVKLLSNLLKTISENRLLEAPLYEKRRAINIHNEIEIFIKNRMNSIWEEQVKRFDEI